MSHTSLLISVHCEGKTLLLATSKTWYLVTEMFNPACTPPLSAHQTVVVQPLVEETSHYGSSEQMLTEWHHVHCVENLSYYGSNKVKGVVNDLLSVILYVRTLRSVTHIHTNILLWMHYIGIPFDHIPSTQPNCL